MTTRRTALIATSALVLLAGCGSSSSNSSSSSQSSSAQSGSTSGGSSLKTTTTPQFASPSASSPVLSGTVQIAYHDIAIHPDVVRVKAGSTVRWTNYDGVEHNVTSESGPQQFASKDFGEGHTFEVKLTKPGVIHYQCTIHPASMNGVIEVVK
jgi:plastocyanin